MNRDFTMNNRRGMKTFLAVIVLLLSSVTDGSNARASALGTGPNVPVSSRTGTDMYVAPGANNTLYVKKGSTGQGSSWSDAMGELADALKWANEQVAPSWDAVNPLKIYVAKGTYTPQHQVYDNAMFGTSDRDKAFRMIQNVKIYGGFAGNETSLNARDPALNETILSGDLDNNGVVSDGDAYHVVISAGDVGVAELNGVVVTGGNANVGITSIGVAGKLIMRAKGGGIYSSASSLVVNNVTVINNKAGEEGGGMLNERSSAPEITNSRFENNSAGSSGGGMYNGTESAPKITDGVFENNHAGSYGGGMHSEGFSILTVIRSTFNGNTAVHGAGVSENRTSSSTFKNCVFSANTATTNGGGMRVWGSSPDLINCLFTDNKARSGGGMYNAGNAEPRIVGSTFRTNCSSSGGAIHNDQSNSKLINSLIVGNSGGSTGGGMDNVGGSRVTIVNSTFSLNTAAQGGGVSSIGSSVATISNSVVWGNTSNSELTNNFYRISNSTIALFHSYVEGNPGVVNTNYGSMDEGTKVRINTPFIDSPNGDFALKSGNEAVEGGSNARYSNFMEFANDQADNPRIVDEVIDMGALEAQSIIMVPGVNNIVYVNTNVVGGNQSGSSWKNAIPEVAAALKQAQSKTWTAANPLKIYVAKGIYKPAYRAANTDNGGQEATARDRAFVMVPNVKLFGGFAGQEASLAERDWGANETVLSGSLGNSREREDSDAYHVVIAAGNIQTAELNGFTITRGNANASTTGTHILVNTRPIDRSNGGGMVLNGADLMLHNIKMMKNGATRGAGVSSIEAAPILVNVEISNNVATAEGSAIYNFASFPVLTNLTLAANIAADGGGAIYNTGNASPKINNTIIWGNTAINNDIQTIVNAAGSSPSIRNSLLQADQWNAAWGSDGGANRVGLTTPFTSITDLSPKVGSQAIDAGNNVLFPNLDVAITKDLSAKDRVRGNSIDIGAYEHQGISIKPMVPNANNIIFVNASVIAGDATGNSWTNAVPKLADVLVWAKATTWTRTNPLKIYVAKGTYKPMYDASDAPETTEGGRDNAFVMVPNVQLYGGFTGNETELAERDRFVNETILSGDIGAVSDTSDNAYHVVLAVNNVGVARLDGFTVTNGNASGGPDSIAVNGVQIPRNSGGGLYQQSASATIINCIFTANNAENRGGAYYSAASSAILSNTVFHDNKAVFGAALYDHGIISPRVISCVFYDNIAIRSGGALYSSENSTSVMINSTISKNTAGDFGAGIFNEQKSNASVFNSIVWGNRILGTSTVSNFYAQDFSARSNVSFSYLEGEDDITGSANIVNAASPFVNWTNLDFSLTPGGQTVDAGNNGLYIGNADVDTDAAGHPRMVSRLIDMGAYEYQFALPAPDANNIVYVNKSVQAGNRSGDSWANAIPELADALKWAREQITPSWNAAHPLKIYVAQGTYRPMDKVADVNNTNEPTHSTYNTFVMVDNVKLYGGFLGNETALEARNWKLNRTILSGNRSAEHVVISVGDVGEAELNGFTITQGGGLAPSLYPDGKSRHIVYKGYAIREDRGSGMYNVGSSPRIENCLFQNNESALDGAAMYNDQSNPTIINSLFMNNRVPRYRKGAALANSASSPVITNSTFVNNANWNDGSEITNSFGSFPQINNSIIFSFTNMPSYIVSSDNTSKPVIKNSYLMFGSTYWNEYLGEDGGGNSLSIPPKFKVERDGTMTFEEDCVAINGGSDALYLAAGGSFETMDIEGNSRLAGCSIDMGAVEWQDPPPCLEPGEGNIIYVNQAVVGGVGSGNAWKDAIPELATALQLARAKTWTSSNPLKIYVAKGMYKPMFKVSNEAVSNPTTDRDMAFRLHSNVQLFGGFEGNETTLEARDWRVNETVLSGDLGTIGNPTDNAYHVVLSVGDIGQALIDGFLIQDGNANVGGDVILGNDRIHRGSGGGMYIHDSSPALLNTIFRENSAARGGGMYMNNTSSKIVNTVFAKNTGNTGGGIYVSGSPKIVNATLTENRGDGGGIYYVGNGMVISNTILWGNKDKLGEQSDWKISSGAITFQNSYLSGATDEDEDTNKIRTTSPFIATEDENYELRALSDAIGAGDNSLYAAVTDATKDLNAQGRIVHSTIDMGPYEYQGPEITPIAKIMIKKNKLTIGQTSLVTIVFDEPMTGLGNDDLIVGNGTLSSLATTDGTTWTGTLTPDLDVHNRNNVIYLDNTGVMDGTGTPGVGLTASDNYAVYTKRPTAKIVVSEVELQTGGTSLVTISFDKGVTGFDNNKLTVASGILSDVQSFDNITWTAILTPNAATFEKVNRILLDNEGIVDGFGNTGSGTTVSNSYFVRTQPGTLLVTSLLDSGEDMRIAASMIEDEKDGDGLSLREAINWALAGDEIAFDLGNGTEGTVVLGGSELAIEKSVIINGDINNDGIADITISGGNKSRVMRVSGDYDVQLTGVKLTKGMIISEQGAGLAVNNSAKVVIRNSLITDNTSTGGGGGLYGYLATVTLINTTVSNNRAKNSGGGIAHDSNTLNIINSTISGNTSRDGDGGGVHLSGGTVNFVNATISGNSATGASSVGGGVRVRSAPLHLYNTTIVGNAATAGSGGLSFTGRTTLINTVIAGNRASNAGIGAIGGSPLASGGLADDVGTRIDKAVNSYFGSNAMINDDINNLNNMGTTNLLLGSLAYLNNSNVQTHEPEIGSGLADAGSNADLPLDTYDLDHDGDTDEYLPIDANGNRRVNGIVDIGAVEINSVLKFDHLNGGGTFIEKGNSIVMDHDVTVSHRALDILNSGRGDYDGASLVIMESGGLDPDVVFGFVGSGFVRNGGQLLKNGKTIADFDTSIPQKLVIRFTNANDEAPSTADVNQILQQITYSTTSRDPKPNVNLDWTFDDGRGNDVTETIRLTVGLVNDAPTLVASPENPTYTEKSAAVSLFSDAVVNTIEEDQMIIKLSLTVENLANGAEELLRIDGQEIILMNGTTGVTAIHSVDYSVYMTEETAIVILTSAGMSAPGMQDLVNGIGYRNASHTPNTANRVITLTGITDNGGTANGGEEHTTLSIETTVSIESVNDAPTITGTPATSVEQDMLYGFIPTAIDLDGDTLTFSILNKPIWATFNPATGELSGIPGNGDVGFTMGIIISVSDRTSSVSLASFNLEVVNVNDGPTISGTPETTVEQGTAYSFIPIAEDIDGDILTFTILNKPYWADFDVITGELSGTPGSDDVGITTGIVIIVSDGRITTRLAAFDLEVRSEKTFIGVTLNDISVVYDGTQKTLVITGTPSVEASVIYINNRRTDAGTQTVTALITAAGYVDLVLTAELTITQAKLSGITFVDASFVYDGSAKSLVLRGPVPIVATVTYVGNSKIEAGDHIVNGTISGSKNYADTTLSATLTITQAKLSGITFADASFVYDGFEKSLVLAGPVPTDATVTYNDNNIIDAGDHIVNVMVSGSNNYADTILTATLTITQAEFSGITLTDASFVYDGSAKSLVLAGTVPVDATVTYDGNSKMEGGSHMIKATISGSNNYADTTMTATLTITQAKLSGVALLDASFVYDGSAKSLVLAGTVPVDATVTYVGNSKIEAGAHLIKATISGSNNYADSTLSASLIITQAELSGITLTDASFVYDGFAKSLVLAGTVPVDATVTYDGNSKMEAGDHIVNVIVSGSNNYADTTLTATLTITQAELPGITLLDGSFVYDGSAKSLVLAGTVPVDATVTYVGNSKVEAGGYLVNVTVSGSNNYADSTLSATLTITQAELSGVTFVDASFVYDGFAKSLVLAGTVPIDATVIYTGNNVIDAGEHPVTVMVSGSNNYADSTLSATLIITQAELPGITLSDASFVYDGSAKSLVLAGTVPIDATVIYTGNNVIDAGEHPVTVMVSGSNNYADTTLTATLTITQAKLSGLTLADASFAYDGSAQSLVLAGTVPVDATVTYDGNSKMEAGDHIVNVMVSGSNNYADSTLTATLTITQAKLSGIMFVDASFVYDGSAKSLVLAGAVPVDATVIYTGNNVIDAGEHPVTVMVSGSNNYADSTLSATLRITQAELSGITLLDASFVYDGSAKSLVLAGTVPVDATITYDGNSRMEAGEHPVTVMVSGSKNYADTTLTATLTITQAKLSGITLSDASFVYDGFEKSLVLAGTVPIDATVTYDGNSEVEAGGYLVNVMVSGSNNYADSTLTATLTITQAKLSGITLLDASFVYDGSAKSLVLAGTVPVDATVTYVGNSKIEGGSHMIKATISGSNNYADTTLTATLTITQAKLSGLTLADASFVYDGSAKSLVLAGTVPVDATVTYDGNSRMEAGEHPVTVMVSGSKNYADTTLTATLTITQAKLSGITLSDASFVYDGSAKSLVLAGTVPVDATVTYDGNSKMEAGNHIVNVIVSSSNNYVDTTLTATLTITQAKLSGITLSDASFVYDGSAKSLVLAGTVPVDATVTYDGNSKIEGGSHMIKATISGSNNYADTTLTATLTITQAELSGLTLLDASFVYDGSAKSLVLEGTVPVDATVIYTGNNVIDAGEHPVTVMVSGSNNYADTTLTATLTITQAKLTGLTLSDASFVYDGSAKLLSIDGTLPDGVSVLYSQNSRIDAGMQVVTATIGGTNYQVVVLTAELKITKAEALITADEQQMYDFDGKKKGVMAKLNHGESELTYDPQQFYTEPGIYDVRILAAESMNYLPATELIRLVIEKPKADVLTFESRTVTFNGKAHMLEVKGLSKESVVTYTGNDQINAGSYTVTATVTHPYVPERTLIAILTIQKANQQIDFSPIGTVSRDAGSVPLNVGSNSRLALTLSSDDPFVATVDGGNLLIHRLGTVRVTAWQAGDENYEAADPVTIIVRVEDENEGPVKVHQAVSPNGDGINDFLYIEGIREYPENRLQVLTRSGLVVFDSEGYDNVHSTFEGISNIRVFSGDLPEGTYFYVLKFKDGTKWKSKKGWFVLKVRI